jgi:paraquat-inducible protein B
MSKPVSKTMIGVFVVGAVALVVLALVVFGSGRFFSKKSTYVLFFEDSVKGLNVGAPVLFKGVKVGQVKNITLLADPEDLTFFVAVYIEVDRERYTLIEHKEHSAIFEKMTRDAHLGPLIQKGLKAQLQTQSFVTGQLIINIDFYPDKSFSLVGIEKDYQEIPTIPGSMERLTKTLQHLDFEKLYNKIMEVVSGIDKIVNAPGADDSLPELRDALRQAQQTFDSVEATIQKNQKLGYDMDSTLKELNSAIRSLRALADYLERHPEALIKGKKK